MLSVADVHGIILGGESPQCTQNGINMSYWIENSQGEVTFFS